MITIDRQLSRLPHIVRIIMLQNGTVTPKLPDSSSIEYTGMLLLKMAFPCVKGKSWQSVWASTRCF